MKVKGKLFSLKRIINIWLVKLSMQLFGILMKHNLTEYNKFSRNYNVLLTVSIYLWQTEYYTKVNEEHGIDIRNSTTLFADQDSFRILEKAVNVVKTLKGFSHSPRTKGKCQKSRFRRTHQWKCYQQTIERQQFLQFWNFTSTLLFRQKESKFAHSFSIIPKLIYMEISHVGRLRNSCEGSNRCQGCPHAKSKACAEVTTHQSPYSICHR